MLHLTLKDLETFKAIARHNSVTLAAQEVGLTQSAASQSLNRLEDSFNVSLFDRIGKRLHLNENGRLLLSRVHVLLDHAQQIETLFTQQLYHLRIGASTTIANYILPQQLAQLRIDHPQAHVQMHVSNTQDIVDAVANLSVDVGFIEGPCHHPHLLMHTWLEDELIVFTSATHPLAHQLVSKAQLAKANWVLREPGSGTREQTDRLLKPHLAQLNIAMELGHSEAIKHTVMAGVGVGCLSRHVIAKELEMGLICPVKVKLPPLKRDLYCIEHKEKARTLGVQAFLDLCGQLSA